MVIDPLLNSPARALFRERGPAKRDLTSPSPFEALLGSVKSDGTAKIAQQAAAELLRVEMMQSSLSLGGEGEASAVSSGVKAMESLFCSATGTRRNYVVADGKAGEGRSAEAPLLGEAGKALFDEAGAKVDTISDTAARFIGTPYRFGGEGPKGIDCSSFVQQVFKEHQISLPRTAREQSHVGTDVAAGDLKKGDLVFFHTYASYPSHVGIYLGDGKMIHASSAKGEVTVSDINTAYYRSRFLGARRIA